MAMPSGQRRRQEFSFPGGSPARRGAEHALPPRPPVNPLAPRAGEEDFRWLQASRLGSPDSGSGGSGTPSPQLWAHHQQQHRLYPASAGSSPSRAQAIAGYRREMLDLVRDLPESAYELSLRDIVESPSPRPPPPPPPHTDDAVQEQEEDEPKKDVAAATVDDEAKKQRDGGAAKKQEKAKARRQRTMGRTRSRSLERSVSLDTGLLIKLFLPLSVGGKKKVSPKPAAKDGKKKKKQGKKEKEKAAAEWCKKSEFSEAGSSSRTNSTSSSDSTGSRNGIGNGSTNPKAPTRSRSRKRIGCYGFFRANKSKDGVNQE